MMKADNMSKEDLMKSLKCLINNSTYGKLVTPTKQIAVHLKDNKDGINIIIIDGDEMNFAMNDDLVINKNGKCVALFKCESFVYAHKY